ncbi:phosphotransferase family protein [Desulfofustis glycolicus]|uniref:Phosphotransferase enzyme family protein n=1 Tax=Desulfofustis glycolicus DSM 9705 TaxID=1121409 RepID=A0A1M5X2C2_9BACT|nr:aminoglycoside phosphotransferase family protein [Desulfofustis glycolicus]MCB2215578.1 aminoglycoside phosphotransferase family protein [Desulfobulbaceae bacterium]SHH93931.1 Phosphotransferase enzyme family protein [Desulfofustis glycolicus DSM 9705]
MAKHHLLEQYRSQVASYLAICDWGDVPLLAGRRFRVEPLAGGEYNLNYLLVDEGRPLVFRVNIGTQIGRDDQIVYEYEALRLLEASGVTPVPYFVDNSRRQIDRGIAIMQYLPGRPLDYRRDLADAARTLASIHRVRPAGDHHLVVERRPLSLIFKECSGLLQHYFESPLGSAEIKRLLERIIVWAADRTRQEKYFQDEPWFCIVNTEVNSGNFIVNDALGTTHLIDWEMPRWGDPSTDLCHFYSPLTTLWKSDFRFSEPERRGFLDCYLSHLGSVHLRRSLDERLRIKFPFVLLRGISWSAMGWVAYQTDYQGVRNEDTWRTLQRYLDADFIRSLFQPLIEDAF